MEKHMRSIATLRHRLDYVGTVFPNSLLEATLHAVEVGAVEARRRGVQPIHVVQEVTACHPELLTWPTLLVVYEEGKNHVGMIFLERDVRALFLFRTAPALGSSGGDRSSFLSGDLSLSSTDDDEPIQDRANKSSSPRRSLWGKQETRLLSAASFDGLSRESRPV